MNESENKINRLRKVKTRLDSSLPRIGEGLGSHVELLDSQKSEQKSNGQAREDGVPVQELPEFRESRE